MIDDFAHDAGDRDAVITAAATIDVSALLRRELMKARRHAKFWRQLSGRDWRADQWTARAARLELLLNLNLTGVAAELGDAWHAAVADLDTFPGWDALLVQVADRRLGREVPDCIPDDFEGPTS